VFCVAAIASLSSVTTSITPSQTHYRDPSFVTIVGAGFRQLADPDCRVGATGRCCMPLPRARSSSFARTDYAPSSTTTGTFLTSSMVLCLIPTSVLPGYHVIDVSNGCDQWANTSTWFVSGTTHGPHIIANQQRPRPHRCAGSPNVTSFSPAMPLEATNVTVNVDYISPQGDSFQCRFQFGSGSSASAQTPATIVSATHVTTTQVRCTVPRIPSGTIMISVATGLGGGFGLSQAYDFPVPEIDTSLLAAQPIALSNATWIVLPAINVTSPRLGCVAIATAGNVSSLPTLYLNASALQCWLPGNMAPGSYVLRITNDGWNMSSTSVSICVSCGACEGRSRSCDCCSLCPQSCCARPRRPCPPCCRRTRSTTTR